MSALEIGQFFLPRNQGGAGGKAQNCWNNIKVIPLSGLERKIIYMCFNSGMMQMLF